MKRRQIQRSAFTLMEVLLVLAILLVIMGLVVPKVLGRQKTANEDATRISIEGLNQAVKLYSLDHNGTPPSSTAGLKVLLNAGTKDRNWKGPYLDKPARDAWGNPLQYRFPGKRNPKGYDIISAGPDGIPETDDDLGNWE
jgi:general secretion pathway protein G